MKIEASGNNTRGNMTAIMVAMLSGRTTSKPRTCRNLDMPIRIEKEDEAGFEFRVWSFEFYSDVRTLTNSKLKTSFYLFPGFYLIAPNLFDDFRIGPGPSAEIVHREGHLDWGKVLVSLIQRLVTDGAEVILHKSALSIFAP